MVNYGNGKIYKLVNSANDIVYIGSTCQKLNKRMGKHREDGKNIKLTSPINIALRTVGIHLFSIVLVKHFPCASKEELYAEEYNTMKQFKSDGVELYNSIIDNKLSPASIAKRTKSQSKGGSVYFNKKLNSWIFEIKSPKRICRAFSVNKYGNDEAKQLAEEEKQVR